MNAGHGQVQRSLLLRLEPEVGKVVGVGVDAVAQLILAVDGHHQYRHPFVPQQALVPLEGLPPGTVGVGIARYPVSDLAEAQRSRGVQKHQQQVGDPFQPVETLHRAQSRATRTRF